MKSELQLHEALRRTELAEEKVKHKEQEIQQLKGQTQGVASDYEKLLKQLTKEVNNQVALNEKLQTKISELEQDRYELENEAQEKQDLAYEADDRLK